jgi:TetR/AcrR family transcriptional repressor of nem operon
MMPGMSEASALLGHGSARERIVVAATRLFWQRGYHAVSTGDICRAAGVLKGSLYHAFPAKADILTACLEQVWTRNWADIKSLYARSETPEAGFRAHLSWFAESQRRLRDEAGVVLGTFDMALGVSIPSQVVDDMQCHIAEHFALTRSAISAVLNLGPDDESYATWLAEIVLQLANGTMIRARLSNDLAPLEALPATVVQLLRATSRWRELG